MRPFTHSLLAAFLAIVSTTTTAIEQVVVSLGTLEGEGWVAKDVEFVTDAIFTSTTNAHLRIASLVLSGQDITISSLDIACQSVTLTAVHVACKEGTLSAGDVLGMQLAGDISIDYAFSGDVSLTAGLDRFAGGRLFLTVSQRGGDLLVRLRGTRLDSGALKELAGKVSTVPDYQLTGRITLELEYEPDNRHTDVIRWKISGSEIGFGNASGTQAGENIALALSGKATSFTSGWRLSTSANLQQGLVYIDPVYLDAGGQDVTLHMDGVWDSARNELSVSRLVYRHKDVLEGSATGRMKFSPSFAIREYEVTVDKARFPAAYQTYLQPWAYGTLVGELETGGVLSAHVSARDTQIRTLGISLDSIVLEDERGRFSLTGLDANAAWAHDDQMRPVDLSWESGSLYRIALGATHLPLIVGRDSVALREPARIAVLDGALEIDQWNLVRPGQSDMTWSFDGVLTPISLEDISAALDWPPFSGRLSGVIPDVRYENEMLTVGGVLLVRAFDGELTVRDLSFEEPFGLVPRLSANVLLSNLDLKKLTRAFSFGRIEGRLGGYINDLRLVNWQPVAFDAAFANPQDDEARHRISQKAIDNLSNIGGGGVGSALSKTFLGAFKEFPYDRLGISCRLARGVCHMGGVARAPEGYYIVKGRLLPPRIDIVGYSDRVDWQSLLARLKAAISSGEVTVQ